MSKIIPILKQVIYALENNFTNYDWLKQGHCNCGHVAQIILNKNGDEVGTLFAKDAEKFCEFEIKDEITYKNKPYFFGLFNTKEEKITKKKVYKRPNIGGTWKDLTQSSCSATGLSGSTIIKAFQSAGFRPEDIVHIEFLENKAILANSDIKIEEYYYTKKSNLIKYMKSWVQILENQDKNINYNTISNKPDLEKELLIAVSNEDYDKAAKIRDKITLC